MTKKEEARKLWEMSFDDFPEFTELYFRKRYTDQNTIAVYDNQEMISVLQLLPYPFYFLNQSVDSAYISGACTHIEYRNKGAMHQLLVDSLKQLYQANTPICTLIPAEEWLFGYYQRSGFETVFYNAHFELQLPDLNYKKEIQVSFNSQLDAQSLGYLEKRMKSRKAVILHPEQDLEVVMEDLLMAQGRVFIARAQKVIVGLLFAYLDPADKKIHVNEILADDCTIKQELFKGAAKYFGTERLQVVAPAHHLPKEPFGMLRIVQVLPILEIFAQANPEWKEEFILEDPIIKQNQGLYSIANGKVKFVKRTTRKNLETKSINALTLQLFEELNPYMSLMLD